MPATSSTLRPSRVLTIDNVLDMSHLDQASLSPDGRWVAAVVQRPASASEVYGRNAYEIDPSRNDIWLISRRTGERRNITNGAATAAGYWCASWSPDGRRLAMLSTQPEHGEPRGGDNVHLYVWDRETSKVARISDAAIMTQTRYGGGIDRLDMRGGADGSTIAHVCNDSNENTPFLWLDDRRLLAATLPTGQVSGLIDQYNHAFRQEARDAQALHNGDAVTVMAVGSGSERLPPDASTNRAILRTIDVTTRAAEIVASVPTYPFLGELSISVSPDRRRLSILATVAAFQPETGKAFPPINDDTWTVQKRLGFVDLAPDAPMHWVEPPPAGKAPLELYGWSPDSNRVALRARSDPFSRDTPLFIASALNWTIRRVGDHSVGGDDAGFYGYRDVQVLWLDDRRIVAFFDSLPTVSRRDWWLLGLDGSEANLTGDLKQPPTGFRRSTDGRLITIAADTVLAINPATAKLVPVGQLATSGSISWPLDPGMPTSRLLLATSSTSGGRQFQSIILDGKPVGNSFALAASATIMDANLSAGVVLFSNGSTDGLFLRETELADGKTHALLALDTKLASIDWGQRMLIDYRGKDGTPLKGAVILPPGYRPGQRYPTLVWVYQGNIVPSLESDYFTDPRMPGIYNLQDYAARGYVILVPSLPLPPNAQRGEVYAHVTDDLMPAIDRLVALGIADPDRLGVFGQSWGGYSVYAIVTQSNRFKAAVAMAGITDLTQFYNEFNPNAHGYPGIENEMSVNSALVEQDGRHVPPHEDYAGYWRNSPLAYVDRVTTPLLMVHGEHDDRAAPSEAESFFSGLYVQGKTARLLRYGGETHSLAQSPANIRDIFRETVGWFDKYVKGEAAGSAPPHYSGTAATTAQISK